MKTDASKKKNAFLCRELLAPGGRGEKERHTEFVAVALFALDCEVNSRNCTGLPVTNVAQLELCDVKAERIRELKRRKGNKGRDWSAQNLTIEILPSPSPR